MAHINKGDWLYLGLSTFAAWVLIQQERDKDANLEILRVALKVVLWGERKFAYAATAIRREIDKELDGYGS